MCVLLRYRDGNTVYLGSCSFNTRHPWRWRQYVPPKRWYLPTSSRGVRTQKTNMDIMLNWFLTPLLPLPCRYPNQLWVDYQIYSFHDTFFYFPKGFGRTANHFSGLNTKHLLFIFIRIHYDVEQILMLLGVECEVSCGSNRTKAEDSGTMRRVLTLK